MKLPHTRLALPRGQLDLWGHGLGELSTGELLALVEPLPAHSDARAIELAGQPAWFKGSPLRGHASRRHALRGLCGLPLPRVREYTNLAWLGERLFRVPEPVVAGCVRHRGLPLYQFLVTRRVAEAEPLDAALSGLAPELRGLLIRELAHESARMHALHFVHHDLFVRNLLVSPPRPSGGDQRRLIFIDAWRGGPDYLPRGPAYDLACLMLEGAALFTPLEQTLLLREYLAESAAQGRTPNRPRLLAAIVRERARLMARIDREPTRWRGPGAPVTDWRPPREL